MSKHYYFFLLLLLVSARCFTQNTDLKNEWHLGIQMWTFNSFTFLEALDKADSCGVKYIEGFPGQKIGGSFKGELGPLMSKNERIKLKNMIRKRRFIMPAFGVVSGIENADADQKWRAYFDFARDMGIHTITAEPELAQLDLINELAGKYHIRVAIHDHPKPDLYANPEAVLMAIKNRPNLGACADVGHWARNGLNVVQCLRKLNGRVFSVHLKDINEFNKVDARDVILGSGVCELPSVFQELKRQGFSGILSIEHEVESGYVPLSDVRDDVRYFYMQQKKLE